MFKLDLGVIIIHPRVNYEIESAFYDQQNKWIQITYPKRQTLCPLVFTFESSFVDTSLAFAGDLSDVVRALKVHRNADLRPEWHTNPLLRTSRVLHRIDRAIHNDGSQFYISYDYILIADPICRSTHEFYYQEARKLARQKDAILLLSSPLKAILPSIKAALIHGSGILLRDHRAIIFLAQSGGGKTTVTRLAQRHGYKVLGDDRNLISQRNDSYFASSVPFNRITDGPDWGEIGAFVILKKGTSFSLVPASPVDVLPKVWADNISQWFMLLPESRRMLFSLYSDMFSNVPVYEMTFEKDYVDWAAIESVLETD
ncbi:MAG: hypothetical protein KBH93_04085 [Anaerolineae bacterium]|nr:hypothetical protein [Anaerolineae bacterium]